MLKSKSSVLIAVCFSAAMMFSAVLPAWPAEPTPAASKDSRLLTIVFPATLCATELPDELLAMFEKEYSIPVKKINLCTGDADKIVRSDSAEPVDAFIGHEQDIENKLIADGYFINFRQVLYSNFVLVGPKEDPAGIKGIKRPAEALKIIQKKKALFFSRGDNSGTHGLEKKMWKLANIEPKGDWYITTKSGTDATLVIANRKKGYTIVHYPSFIQQQETLDMDIMVNGDFDNKLVTAYDIMAANPQKYPNSHYVDAMTFIGYITSPKIQKYIGEFGKQKFKCQINFPMAVTGK